jgi:hypothetical protein
MKKRFLKSWVVNVLIGIEVFGFMFLGADHPDLATFFWSKVITLIVMIRIGYILKTQSNLFEEDQYENI